MKKIIFFFSLFIPTFFLVSKNFVSSVRGTVPTGAFGKGRESVEPFKQTESFIVQKPKRTTSRKKLQEWCCDVCADASESVCAMIGSLNMLQQELLVGMRQFVEGSKSAPLGRANKEQLATLHVRLKSLTDQVDALRKTVRIELAYLQKI